MRAPREVLGSPYVLAIAYDNLRNPYVDGMGDIGWNSPFMRAHEEGLLSAHDNVMRDGLGTPTPIYDQLYLEQPYERSTRAELKHRILMSLYRP